MLLKTRGIVLRALKYSETSLIIEIYTEAQGLKKYIVSGVRSRKAKVSANLLQVMSLLDIIAYNKQGKDLNRIKELKSFYTYQKLPFNVYRSSVGLFITEVAQKTLRQSESNEALFRFLLAIYTHLDQSEQSIANVHLYFLVHFTQFLGFTPDGNYDTSHPYFNLREGTFMKSDAKKYALNQRLSQLLSQLLDSSLEDSHQISMNRLERHQFVDQLLRYYQLHIDNFPKISAHAILKEVLE
ncbi:MAG: DNA repair protein RecO [Bacteroidota bacterium]